jgi:deazaflavin-dependent oxidoreductase (nitroreductase family)
MSFDTPNGTRGAGQPRAGRLLRWFNKWAMSRARKDGRVMGAMNALVLTTVGRKSGVERSTPVGYFPDKDGSWLIVASASGAPKNPAWYYNIAAHPDNVQIETGGRKIAVTAEQLHGPARDKAWQQISTAAPRFAQYQQKTDREIPVIRLVPAPGER